MIELRDQARNKWPSILAQLGVSPRHLSGKHCPCPICGGKDRFRFDDRHGEGGWFCNACKSGNGVDLLMKANDWTFAETAERVRSVLGEAKISRPKPAITPDRAVDLRRQLWRASAPIGDDEAAAYLLSRGFIGPYSDALRFCSDAAVTGHPTRRTMPAMLALVTAPDGKAVNIHRTYLEGARKAKMEDPRRMMPGEVPHGSAIRLGKPDGILAIAEGIETALAVTRDFGFPCWSLISAQNMAAFRVPLDVCELHVFGDNDAKFAGQAAAYAVAHRAATGRLAPKVRIHIPEVVGTDWADPHPQQKRAVND